METFLILPAQNQWMAFIRKHSRLLFVLTLPVYFFIVQQSIQNKHTHFYPNGIVVTHSHPVDADSNEPVNHHNHTKTEICFFNTFHFNFVTLPDTVNVVFSVHENDVHFLVSNDIISYSADYLKVIPRGPPA